MEVLHAQTEPHFWWIPVETRTQVIPVITGAENKRWACGNVMKQPNNR